MKKKFELLAPGGDADSIKAAIAAGADAVYCGLKRFNARNRAANIDIEELNGIINLARSHDCRVFLTLNIIIAGSEIPALFALLNELVNTDIDGVIVQDFGLFYLLTRYFKKLEIHASTQLTTHNEGQIAFLDLLGVRRVNLSRELNISEIRDLTTAAHAKGMETEVFVHGSYCLSFSGICYISSLHGGNSGNRGRCSQPCRERYLTTPAGKNYPLNLKDNSAFSDIRELSEAGVDSLKIEGRIKKADYVYTVVKSFRAQLELFYDQGRINRDKGDLYKVFNRDFSNGYLTGNIDKDMFIDSPRDHSICHLSEVNPYASKQEKEAAEADLYDEKDAIAASVKDKTERLSIEKIPLEISISGSIDTAMTLISQTPEESFTISSDSLPVIAGKDQIKSGKSLTREALLSRFNAVNNTGYFIKRFDIDRLGEGLFLPFKELNSMKNRILARLTGAEKRVPPVTVPFLTKPPMLTDAPGLSVLISSRKDLEVCSSSSADIFFRLPDCMKAESDSFTELFLETRRLIPWFPSVIIGEDYSAAVEFLHRVKPERIVTNNTGIAFESFRRGIPWIAGPFLNLVNSFSLVCLKEKAGCSGAFISNEINRFQLKSIIRPENFQLYYSIYHPIQLMTSRQCLFHPVTGCTKERIDAECIQKCTRSASIENDKNSRFYIEKSAGNYHTLYNSENYLNTDIVHDIPGFFSGFSIDLRDIETETKNAAGKKEIADLFESLLDGNTEAENRIKQMLFPVTSIQYREGI